MFSSKFNRYLERRDEEVRKQDAERAEEVRRRDAEARKRDEEGNARWAQLQQLRERAEAREEETREFNREILLRNEKVYTTAIAEMEEGRKQIQANTQAVLSVLDRFNGSSA
jgi:hypothetical protein